MADREVVQILGSVGDTVVLNVKLLVAEWGECGGIEAPARVQVCHDEEHVIDHDAANGHRFTLSTPGLGSLPWGTTRLQDGCAGRAVRKDRAGDAEFSEDAMKMKGQLNVKTPAEYIAAVDDERRSDIAALDALIRKHAPKLEPVIMDGMIGYGPFHYRNASGREGDACKLSIASNASYISLYCFAADAKGYVAERYVDRLPRASIGKSCVRFKRLTDLDEKALVALIKETAKRGLVA
jgi:hypothetical protein